MAPIKRSQSEPRAQVTYTDARQVFRGRPERKPLSTAAFVRQLVEELWDIGLVARSEVFQAARLAKAPQINVFEETAPKMIGELKGQAETAVATLTRNPGDTQALNTLGIVLQTRLSVLLVFRNALRRDVAQAENFGDGEFQWKPPARPASVMTLGTVRGVAAARLLHDPKLDAAEYRNDHEKLLHVDKQFQMAQRLLHGPQVEENPFAIPDLPEPGPTQDFFDALGPERALLLSSLREKEQAVIAAALHDIANGNGS